MSITREWQSGLELASLEIEFSRGIGLNSGYNAIVAENPKTGTYSFRVQGGTIFSRTYSREIDVSATYQLRVGFHCRTPPTSGNIAKVHIMLFMSAGGSILGGLRSTADGSGVELFYNGNQGSLAGTQPITQNTYFHYGIDVKFDASGWIVLYVDGAAVIIFSGNTGSTQCTKVRFGTYPAVSGHSSYWEGAEYAYYDDIVIDDSSGEGAYAPLDDFRFQLIVPNAAGTYSQWMGSDGNQINNYLLVDEIPPSSADYVSATGTLYKDSYALGDYTLPQNATINAVIPLAVAQKGSASDILLVPGLRLGSDENVPTGSASVLGTSYGRAIWTRHTGTPLGADWVENDVDNVQALIQSYGSFA